MRKYLKGKDGKFKGSLPDARWLPKALDTNSLPRLPKSAAKPSDSISSPADPTYESFSAVRKEEKKTSFYVSSQNLEFLLPESIAAKLERGDIAYFHNNYFLYTDSYGDHNASAYEALPQNSSLLIDLTSERNGTIAEKINAAEKYSDLPDDVKSYFTEGGCAALAIEIHKRMPDSKINVIVAAMIDDPSDATAAHVYVSQGWDILDGFGASRLEAYDYAEAAGVDSDLMDVLAYETDSQSVTLMIERGCFAYDFTAESQDLLGKIADLVIAENNKPN